MKVTSWNVRGLNAPNKQRLFKRCLTTFSSEIVMIQETKLREEDWNQYCKKLGVWKVVFTKVAGAAGGLAILWDPEKVCFKEVI